MINEGYINELKDDSKLRAAIEDTKKRQGIGDDIVFAYPEYAIPDSDVPNVIKENDCRINREFLFVKVQFDSALDRCLITDPRTNREVNLGEVSRGGSYGKNIDIKDIVFMMDREEYNIAKNTSEKIMSLSPEDRGSYVASLSSRESELAGMYYQNIDSESRDKPYQFAHEAHHTATNLEIKKREENTGSGTLSPEDYYKTCEDSEKSAYFSEVLKAIETYHKGGDYDSFKAFPGTRYNWLKEELKTLPVDERKAKVMDVDNLINSSNAYWDTSNDFYRREGSQFEVKTKDYVELNGRVSTKNNNEEYQARKDIYYSFDVYNPDTKTYEKKSLSSKINKEVELNDRAKRFLRLMNASVKSKANNANIQASQNLGFDIFVSEEVKEPEKKKLSVKDIFSFKKKRNGNGW